MSAIHFRMYSNKMCVWVSVFLFFLCPRMCQPIIEFNSNRILFTDRILNGFRWAFLLAHTQSVKSNEWINMADSGGNVKLQRTNTNNLLSLSLSLTHIHYFLSLSLSLTDNAIVVILFCQNILAKMWVPCALHWTKASPKFMPSFAFIFIRAPHTWNVYLSSLVWLSPFCGWWMWHFSS